MQLLASGRVGLHHRINRFSHVVLFGDYEKKVSMWKPPEQTKDKKIIRSKLVVVPYKKCHEAIAAYERQVNLRNLALAPALQGGLFLGASYFSSILYPVGKQLLSKQFWESQIDQFQPSMLLDTLSEGFFDASLGGVLYLIAPLCAFLSMRANFVTYRQSLKFRRRERKEYPLIHRILLDSDTKDIFLEVEVKRKFSAQYKVKKKLVKVTDQEKWTILPTLSPADSMYYSNDNVLTFNNKIKNYVMENFLNAKGDFSKAEKVMEKTDGPKTNREKQKLQRENPINLRNFLAYRHIFFTIDCTFIQSPDGTIYRARRYMPNTTKTLLKEHQDISFIKKFATKLYNDNEKYKAEYIPLYSFGPYIYNSLEETQALRKSIWLPFTPYYLKNFMAILIDGKISESNDQSVFSKQLK